MNPGFSTNIGIFFLRLVAKLPFWVIYGLADVFYFVVYYVVGYRKYVVSDNLKHAFPEKSGPEIKSISKKYFRHFADLTLETVKMSGMSEKEFKKRVRVKNPEMVNKYCHLGKSVVVLTMHYNNWEWAVYISKSLEHKSVAVYKPLQNEQFDVFMNKTRTQFGTELIKNSNVLRRVLTAEQQNDPIFLWLAGDQTPPEFHNHWFRFFNRDALFYPGPAFISKRFGFPVFFQRNEKIGRGVYETTFELLVEKPGGFSETEIIKTYIGKMERIIREKPEYYLWSHKRWKHKRPENIEMQ